MLVKKLVCILFGLAAGIFVGYVSMALAQIVQSWCFKMSVRPVLFAIALGKVVGCIYYFCLM